MANPLGIIRLIHLRCAPNKSRPVVVGVTFGRRNYLRLSQAEAPESEAVPEALRTPWLWISVLAVLSGHLRFRLQPGELAMQW